MKRPEKLLRTSFFGGIKQASLLQSFHPERNFVIGKANDKVESKDPMFVDTTPGNARRSHRAVIARGPAKAVHPPQN